MFKKALYLLLLPSLSWGSTCVIPSENLNLIGVWPQQSLKDFTSEQKGRAIVKEFRESGESREGSLEFKSFDENYREISGIGKVFIGHISFNVDREQITSVSIMPQDPVDDLTNTRKKLMDKLKIPQQLWITNDYGNYSYLCEDYEAEINQNDDRGEISLILRSSFSENYNPIEIIYTFTAMQFITPKVQKRIMNEGIEYSNYDLYTNDPLFRSRLQEVFFEKVGMTIDDFDMGHVLTARDITDSILTTNFYQKNEGKGASKLDMYIAYQTYNNHMLVVTKDQNNNIKSYGDKDSLLISALVKSEAFPIEHVSRVR